MKFKQINKNFENFFTWDKNVIQENKSEINELMIKLLEKRKAIGKKLKKEKNKEEKVVLEKKLKAIKKLIKKAKKNLL